MADELLTMKLYAPPLRPGLVDRPRLIQKLNQSLKQGSQLTILSAPAGYGKTTLALEWLSNLSRPYAWLSLDRTDNHPVQFLTYLIAALQELERKPSKIFPSKLKSYQAESEDGIQRQLAGLINQISMAKVPFVLVLDDYHMITELGVHQALEFLINHQPPSMHLVITTRQDPLLSLSKLRSRRQITEIRMADLRFSPQEATCFLKEAMGLVLLDEEIASLESRTEGWIAGLQLAAISLSDIIAVQSEWANRQKISSFIQEFAGDDRHIMDYLLDEVLSHQSAEVQQFLLHTSILKRFCVPLCDAILESGQREQGTTSMRAILEYLDRSNLFIIPLDNRREWYRYHHLFADLLLNRLQLSAPDWIPMLHKRASQWYEHEGLLADAVDHALLAEDFEQGLSLIEQIAHTSLWAKGELPVLLNWTRRLPVDVFMTRPRLCLYNARALLFAGQVQAGQEQMRYAEDTLKTLSHNDPASDELWGIFYTNQATFAAMNGNCQIALDLAEQALTLLPDGHFFSQAMVYHAIGLAQYYAGRVRLAEQAFIQAVSLARQAGNSSLALDSSAYLAGTLDVAAQHQSALQICDEALAFDGAARQSPAASAIYMTQARILLVLNEPKAALEKIKVGIELAKQLKWAHVLWRGYGDLSSIQLRLGDMAGLQEALRQLEMLAQEYPLPPVGRIAGDWRARLALMLGDKATAFHWANTHQPSGRPDAIGEYDDLTLVRIWIAQGRAQESINLLDDRLPLAECDGRLYMVHEIYVLRAAAHSVLRESRLVLEDLSCALQMGLPEALLKSALLASISRGEHLVDMLKQIRKTRDNQAAAELAGRILALVGSPVVHPPIGLPAGLMGIDLPEPLTARELEVLRLIAEGLSNPKIAARLYVSVNTLRVHTMHIYQKLDVHNRIEAVARAQELGLLHPK